MKEMPHYENKGKVYLSRNCMDTIKLLPLSSMLAHHIIITGRRGPYGVNEYLFQMSPRSLPKLKQTISDYTGAKFQSFDETPVSSDETPPYLHGNHSPEAPRTARHTSSGRYERNAPLPKPRSHSASRQKLDTIKPLPLSSMLFLNVLSVYSSLIMDHSYL